MAKHYVSCDRSTEFLLPPSLIDWLPEAHLAWFIIDAVGQIDTTGGGTHPRIPAGVRQP